MHSAVGSADVQGCDNRWDTGPGSRVVSADVPAGTLANNPALCAGLNRHVAQLPAPGQTNPANFYKAGPANYYAEFWHKNAINGLAYGFPYDDYAGQSSDISVTNPQYMVVAVGW